MLSASPLRVGRCDHLHVCKCAVSVCVLCVAVVNELNQTRLTPYCIPHPTANARGGVCVSACAKGSDTHTKGLCEGRGSPIFHGNRAHFRQPIPQVPALSCVRPPAPARTTAIDACWAVCHRYAPWPRTAGAAWRGFGPRIASLVWPDVGMAASGPLLSRLAPLSPRIIFDGHALPNGARSAPATSPLDPLCRLGVFVTLCVCLFPLRPRIAACPLSSGMSGKKTVRHPGC